MVLILADDGILNAVDAKHYVGRLFGNLLYRARRNGVGIVLLDPAGRHLPLDKEFGGYYTCLVTHDGQRIWWPKHLREYLSAAKDVPEGLYRYARRACSLFENGEEHVLVTRRHHWTDACQKLIHKPVFLGEDDMGLRLLYIMLLLESELEIQDDEREGVESALLYVQRQAAHRALYQGKRVWVENYNYLAQRYKRKPISYL
ncbi:hypothetical protein [Rhizobium terrae]|uniref:hypothetical protein n=1 Tax=Rhizobium terrae TaxID=2171756 RepID=UPI000E3C79F7|nr:hypothetical protein [Rhizobium terrae]